MTEKNEGLGAFPFVIAGVSFIPVIGIPFGLVSLIWGIVTKKKGGNKLALVGGLGIMFTIVLYAGLFYFGFVKRGGIYDELRIKSAQSGLNSVVQALEFYKVQHGSYPESLKALKESLPRDSIVLVFDPTELKPSGSRRYFYYERVGADHYYLRAVGFDGIPFTSDDIVPQVNLTPGSKLGLLIERAKQPEEITSQPPEVPSRP
jgi:hypothetical protein